MPRAPQNPSAAESLKLHTLAQRSNPLLWEIRRVQFAMFLSNTNCIHCLSRGPRRCQMRYRGPGVNAFSIRTRVRGVKGLCKWPAGHSHFNSTAGACLSGLYVIFAVSPHEFVWPEMQNLIGTLCVYMNVNTWIVHDSRSPTSDQNMGWKWASDKIKLY